MATERKNEVYKHKPFLSESELNQMLKLQARLELGGKYVHLNTLITKKHPELYLDSKEKPPYWTDPATDQILAGLLGAPLE